ncbi:MAG: SDR family oxidoreductase [Akkermansiaceae bacterium]|jgi:NAD(P)-dependent dehydrogenase (short-subunit alcohol dehydrogenase family)|tara:strand:+ start:7225 stop:7986 length:762 start_codon:yes stop_codon:yes gene_type:complete
MLKNIFLTLLVIGASFTSLFADKGKVLITGANRGLGLELSRHFIADGYSVIGTARKPDAAADLKKAGARVIQLDVTSDKSIAAMAKELEGVSIDILINNAAYFGSRIQGLEALNKTTREDFLRVHNINVLGPFFVTRALLPNIKLSKNPVRKIIHVSSHSGAMFIERKHGVAYAYGSSKAAFNRMTRSMCADLKSDNIAVVSLAPGHNRTDMGGEKAPLDPKVSMKIAQQTIIKLTMEDTGKFVYFTGKSVKW